MEQAEAAAAAKAYGSDLSAVNLQHTAAGATVKPVTLLF